MNNINPPANYIPEFCQASIYNIQSIILELNNKFSDIKTLIDKNDSNQSNQNEKLSFKLQEIEKLYRDIDKEIFQVKEMSSLVLEQTKINVDFSGNFKSIEKRLKIIFSIIFLGVSTFSALIFICIKIWLSGGI